MVLPVYVGVDLGGTKLRVALAHSGGQIVAARSFPTEAQRGPEAVLHTLRAGTEELLAEGELPRDEVAGLAVCAAGFYDLTEEMMVNSPNLPGWEGLRLRHKLEEMFALPVIVENDASAAAYGEYRFGAGQGHDDLLLLTLGTGIGGGLVLGGQLYRGSQGFAGEIGHIPLQPHGPPCGCGRRGCLEALSSGTAIAREGRRQLEKNTPTLLGEMVGAAEDLLAEHVFAAARRGDGAALKIIEDAALFLGRALAVATTLLNPKIIILTGGMASNGEQLFEPVRRHFHAEVLPLVAGGLKIIGGRLGADSGIRGVLALLEDYLTEPKNVKRP